GDRVAGKQLQLGAAAVAGGNQPLAAGMQGQRARCAQIIVETAKAQLAETGTANIVAIEDCDGVVETAADVDVVAVGGKGQRPGAGKPRCCPSSGVDGLIQ